MQNALALDDLLPKQARVLLSAEAVVIYNAPFDLFFLPRELRNWTNRRLCVRWRPFRCIGANGMNGARTTDGTRWPWHRLSRNIFRSASSTGLPPMRCRCRLCWNSFNSRLQ